MDEPIILLGLELTGGEFAILVVLCFMAGLILAAGVSRTGR